jgi:peptidyl-tRNA hydrolase
MENRTSELVQPILVDKTGCHYGTIRAAALASTLTWLVDAPQHPEPWATWLSGPFTKTVRRVNAKFFDDFADQGCPDDTDRTPERSSVLGDTWNLVSGPAVHGRISRAVALAPLRHDTFPRPVRSAQVSGTDLPVLGRCQDYDPYGTHEDAPVLVLTPEPMMTTGKAAAQAAHGLMAWALANLDVGNAAATLAGQRKLRETRLRYATSTQAFDQLSREATVVIRDAGRTEIPTRTATCLVLNYEQAHRHQQLLH